MLPRQLLEQLRLNNPRLGLVASGDLKGDMQMNAAEIYRNGLGRPFACKSEAEAYRVSNGLAVTHTVAPITEIIDNKYIAGYVVRHRAHDLNKEI